MRGPNTSQLVWDEAVVLSNAYVLQRMGVTSAAQDFRKAHLQPKPKEARKVSVRRCNLLIHPPRSSSLPACTLTSGLFNW